MMTPTPVGHGLGLFDVMGRQDDRDAVFLQAAHDLPHVPAQFHVHARGRLVEEQDPRLMGQRLGDQNAPLHAPRQRPDLAVALVPERQLPQHVLDQGLVTRLAEKPAREPHRVDDLLERFEVHPPAARSPIRLRAAR